MVCRHSFNTASWQNTLVLIQSWEHLLFYSMSVTIVEYFSTLWSKFQLHIYDTVMVCDYSVCIENCSWIMCSYYIEEVGKYKIAICFKFKMALLCFIDIIWFMHNKTELHDHFLFEGQMMLDENALRIWISALKSSLSFASTVTSSGSRIFHLLISCMQDTVYRLKADAENNFWKSSV